MQDLIEVYNKTKKIYEKWYDIHLCTKSEIEEVICFIDKYWQKDHILTKSKELLDWQHYDREKERYNFVIAKSRKNGEIHGIIGFILSSIYDADINTPIRWGAIWKIREDVAVKGLGIVLKGYMEQIVPTVYIGGIGLSKYSKEIDKKLGERMGVLSQYYIANPDLSDYELIKDPEIGSHAGGKNVSFKHFKDLAEKEYVDFANSIKDKIMPYKSVKYYVNRYFRHPIYNYNCIAILDDEDKKKAVFFWRKCMVENHAGIFVVDYIGDGSEIGGTYELFVELLRSEKAEYIAFPCSGIEGRFMKQAGFCLRDESNVVLPVYYEPFVRKNVDMDFHFWSENNFNHPLIVKGDADQDRPSRLPEVYYG